MVIHEDIQEIKKSISALFRNVGKIKTFRRQCFTLIQVCTDLQRHWEGPRQGNCHDLKKIIQEASSVLAAAADPEESKRTGEVSAGFEACIKSIERYDHSYLTSCRHSGDNTARCQISDHNYQAKLATATSADKRRETRAVKIFQKTPREVKGAKKQSVHFIFHSFATGKERTLSHDIYEDTTLSELLYKFNKGIKGVRITLAENPRFYHNLSHPYNTPELLGIKQTMFDSPDDVPRKVPAQDLSVFFSNGNNPIMIHVYVDQQPLISLEDLSASWAFSLAKWDIKSIPRGIFRDREGAMYDGTHLKRLILNNTSDEGALKHMVKTRLSLRSTTAGPPLPLHGFWGLDFWQHVSPRAPFDDWFQTLLERLVDNARHLSTISAPVVTMPNPQIPRIPEPVPNLAANGPPGSAIYAGGAPNTVAHSMLSLNTIGPLAQALPMPQPNITTTSGPTTAVSRVDATWEMPGAYNFPEDSEPVPRSVEPHTKKKSWIRRKLASLIGRDK